MNDDLTKPAREAAETLIRRLDDDEVDRKTAIEAAIQQLRLLVEPVAVSLRKHTVKFRPDE